MAGIREELEFCNIPEALKGAAITLIVAGILSMAFMGFTGVYSGLKNALKKDDTAQASIIVPGDNKMIYANNIITRNVKSIRMAK
jgi:hypothetical protein